MDLKRLIKVSIISVLLVSCQSSKDTVQSPEKVQVISPDKIVNVKVERLSFSGKNEQTSLFVIDVAKNDVLQIVKELKNIKFPIYAIFCYSPRKLRNKGRASLHAYAAAIDVNCLMNPYYDAVEKVIVPKRSKNQEKDKSDLTEELKKIKMSNKEIASVLNVVINNQPSHSDDRFLNRGIVRKGMVTPEVVEIFRRHGFSEWGGNWRRPIDYMHFQIPRSVARKLAAADNFEERIRVWEDHKKSVNRKGI